MRRTFVKISSSVDGFLTSHLVLSLSFVVRHRSANGSVSRRIMLWLRESVAMIGKGKSERAIAHKIAPSALEAVRRPLKKLTEFCRQRALAAADKVRGRMTRARHRFILECGS